LALRPVLIDTGPLVAYLDKADDAHEAVAEFVDECTATLCTTAAVITESMHLLKDSPAGPRRLAEFVQSAQIQVFELRQPQQLLSAVALMEKYSDLPMDFADATLVLLADMLRVVQIVTLDRRGFQIFRTRSKKPFVLFPS
jgi:predicted nucleic acid-binding protein